MEVKVNKNTNKKMTRGTRNLIKTAINSLPTENQNNRFAICDKMVTIMLDSYPGSAFDYQTNRMGLNTTGQILDKIDEYFYKNLGNG